MATQSEISRSINPNPDRIAQMGEKGLTAKEQEWSKFAVYRERQRIIDQVKNPATDVIILDAGTGTGKTRFGAYYALEALDPSSKMIVTENLRDATRESAEGMAKDQNKVIKQEIGYSNKYEHEATKDTRLVFCPVQSLLIRLENDPELKGIDLVAMDEVHKESKANEMCMIQLRQLQQKRKAQGKPLKLMFISATLDQQKITRSFPDAKVETIKIEGENQPIQDIFEPKDTPMSSFKELPIKAGKKTVDSYKDDKGNIIVFLSGKKEIDAAKTAFEEKAKAEGLDLKNTEIIPYYGALPKAEKDRLFDKKNTNRKVVFCTNAAQESLTLDVHVVIDTTVHKHQELDSGTGHEYLKQEKAPKSHLLQRKGRVGRKPLTDEQKQQGYKYKYYALCTQEEWNGRSPQEPPEMERTDLIQEALLMYADGYDPRTFPYISHPPTSHINVAISRLEKLGALKNGALTEKGRFMASLQLQPNLSSMVHASIGNGCAGQAAALASILEEYPEVFNEGNGGLNQFKDEKSDILGFLNVFNKFHSLKEDDRWQWTKNMSVNYQKMKDADDLYRELLRQIQEENPNEKFITKPNMNSLDKAIYAGFTDSLVGLKSDGSYSIVDIFGRLQIDEDSVLAKLKPKHFISFTLRPQETDGSPVTKRYASLNHPISEELLKEIQGQEKAKIEITKEVKKDEKKSSSVKASEDKEEKKDAKKETPKPVVPIKKPSVWQRFKNWLGWIFLGKKPKE